MNYEEIFRERGRAYDEAMHCWPAARRDDFLLPLQWSAPQAGETVVDAPAGGGYLRGYLPIGCSWFGHEPCASFQGSDTVLDQSLLPLPFADEFADLAISIAGVHHLNEKRPFFRELHRVLKSQGRLLLADAHAESSVARFLDDFVGRHNSTGHEGMYLCGQTLEDLQASGFSIVRSERVHYAWWFEDRSSMAAFCRLLFDMRRVDESEIVAAIERHLGLSTRGGEIGMNWELYFVLATRCDPRVG